MRRYNNKAWLLLAPAALLFGAIGLAPLLATFNYSVQDSFTGDHYFWVGFDWYISLLNSPAFWGAFLRTVLLALITIPIQFGVGVFVARKLFHVQKKGAGFVALFALPLLTPWIVVGFIWRHIMDADAGLLGMLATSVGFAPDLNSVLWVWATIILMDVWHWTSLIVILGYAGYLGIPKQYFEAAHIDGASSFAIFRYVEMPRLRRILVIALLLRLADSMMIYIEPLMISRGGPHVYSTFMSQELIKTAMQEFNLGKAGAISVFYLLIMITVAWGLYKSMRANNG